MNRLAGYCAKHNKGPLDVWYDCQGCVNEGKDLKAWKPMPIPMILELISDEDRVRWLRWYNS